MEFGVYMFLTDESMSPMDLAREVEARGFESLWVPEHTHIPASRRTPYPAGGDLPREYTRTLDPFIALTAAALVTERILLGTGICLVIERDPIVLAKEVASLDLLSGGRVLFGVGAGWNIEEMAHHGTDPNRRFAVMAERVRAMQEIWTQEEASFDGEFVRFERVWSWPKPAQRPYPPVILAGGGARVIDRVLDYGDGWMPIPLGPGDGLEERTAELRARAEAADRPRPSVTIYNASTKPAELARYAEAGVNRCVFWLPSGGRDEALPRLDRCTSAAGLG